MQVRVETLLRAVAISGQWQRPTANQLRVVK